MTTPRNALVDDFEGVDINTPAELLRPQRFQRDENGDRLRSTSWRPRRGYSRLLDATGAGATFAGTGGNVPKALLQFERDDATLFTVAAGGKTARDSASADDVIQHQSGVSV